MWYFSPTYDKLENKHLAFIYIMKAIKTSWGYSCHFISQFIPRLCEAMESAASRWAWAGARKYIRHLWQATLCSCDVCSTHCLATLLCVPWTNGCWTHCLATLLCVPWMMGAEHIALSPCCTYPEGSLCLEVEGWEPPETRAVTAISTWTRLHAL